MECMNKRTMHKDGVTLYPVNWGLNKFYFDTTLFNENTARIVNWLTLPRMINM